jgi:hypothetical protein
MLQSFHCDTSTGLELTGVRGNDGVGLIWFSVPRISEIPTLEGSKATTKVNYIVYFTSNTGSASYAQFNIPYRLAIVSEVCALL